MKRQERTAAFLNLGCKVNAYETEAMQRLFLQAGFQLVDFKEEADVYVVNTCTVTNMADRKSRQMLRRARKRNPDAVIAAVGCYVQAAGESLTEDGAVDVLVGNNEKHRIVELVEEYLAGRGKPLSLVDTGLQSRLPYEELTAEGAGGKTRAFIKIQDGCSQFCSYCIIPYVRGRVRSRQAGDVLEEAGRLVQNGYREIVLTGIHLSSYGLDWETGQAKEFAALEGGPLLALIGELQDLEGLERIRLGSLEPRIMTEGFVRELAGYDKVCPHFHLSLQSGCDATLARMNRRYTTQDYTAGVGRLRRYFENPAITTDVIVGFPGETAEEFFITKEFLHRVGFAKMHIFKYSRRNGTKADKMDGQVSEEVKNRRSEMLLELDRKLSGRYRKSFYGRPQRILLEEEIKWEGKPYLTGHNERYVRMALPKNEALRPGQITEAVAVGELNRDLVLCERA